MTRRKRRHGGRKPWLNARPVVDAVACPREFCDAAAGQSCVQLDGAPMRNGFVHRERNTAYRQHLATFDPWADTTTG